MSNYKRLVQPTSALIKQGVVIAIAVYCAVTLLPFIKYKSASTSMATPIATSTTGLPTSLFTGEGSNPAKTTHAQWHPDTTGGNIQHVGYRVSSETSDRPIEKNASAQLTFIPKMCRLPQIPERSISPESEAKTIREINAWIICHNAWSNDIQQHLSEFSNAERDTPAAIKLKQVLRQLQEEDQIEVERTSRSYAEWKKNSLSYKQRLGFRRSLLSDVAPIKPE